MNTIPFLQNILAIFRIIFDQTCFKNFKISAFSVNNGLVDQSNYREVFYPNCAFNYGNARGDRFRPKMRKRVSGLEWIIKRAARRKRPIQPDPGHISKILIRATPGSGPRDSVIIQRARLMNKKLEFNLELT